VESKKFLEIFHRVRSVVEDRGCQSSIGATFGEHAFEILGLPGPARGEHGNVRDLRYGVGERASEAGLDAVGIHGSEQYFARAQQLAFDFDPSHTQVEFTLNSTIHTVRGTFALKRGAITLDPASGNAAGQIVVDAASGNTGSDARDRRMHKEILESGKFPEIIFTPDRVEGQIPAEGDFQLNVHGTFRLHGADHEIILPVRAKKNAGVISATLQFSIPYIQWGLKNPSNFFLRAADHVDITINTVANPSVTTAAGPPHSPRSP